MATGSATLGWFIIPQTVAGNPTQSDGWLVQQASSETVQMQWIAAGYLGPYSSQSAAQAVFESKGYSTPSQTNQQRQNAANQPPLTLPDPISAWLKSLGGDIGSGLEGGLVALLNDLFNVIIGPLEVIAGVAIAIVILVWAMRDELTSVASILAMGAMA